MATSEARKFEIEENVDRACQENNISKKEAFKALQTFHNKIGVSITFGAIKTKYYRAKDSEKKVSNETFNKSPRKHTKPEIKKQLSDVAEAKID